MFGLSDLATRLIIVFALAAGSFGAGCAVTYKIEQGTIEKMKAEALQHINDAWKAGWMRRDQQQAVAAKSDQSNSTAQQHVASNTQEVIRYVPKYITVKDDAACVLPDDFERLLDAAQLGVAPDDLPAGTGLPVGAPPRHTLSEATGLLVQILGDYASVRARLLNAHAAWQSQAAIFGQGNPTPAKP